MKTLLFTLEYPPFHGGVANYYGFLAKYWPIGEKLIVMDNNRGELLPRKGPFAWWSSVWLLKRKIIQDNIDYLLVGQILPLGTAAYIVSLFMPIKYAVFLHGMDFAYALRAPHKSLLSKLILKKADKIICANSYVQEKLIEFLPVLEDKIGILNPGIEGGMPEADPYDVRDIQNNYNLEGKTILLTVGRLVKRKGIDRTIQAIIQMPLEQSKNLIYFIIGIGPRDAYLKSLVPPDYAKQIIFLGEIGESEKWAWLRLCDIFIMPSRDISGDFEGFGIVYLEAALCAKPVIAGNSGGVRDAVVNEVTGLLVDPENIDEIGKTIMRLAADPALREKLGKQGKTRALKDFNWENQAKRILQFIK